MVTLNKTKKFTFKSIETCPLDELGNQLSHFFMVVSKSDGSTLNASSLKAYHIALARYLNQRRNNSVDIKKDSRFRDVAAVLKARCTEAASKGERPQKIKLILCLLIKWLLLLLEAILAVKRREL